MRRWMAKFVPENFLQIIKECEEGWLNLFPKSFCKLKKNAFHSIEN